MAGKDLLIQGEQRRKQILLFLRSYVKKNGYAPTIQEICDSVGLVSPNATRNHLQKLQDLGFITMVPRIARAIALVDPQPSLTVLNQVKVARRRKAKVPDIDVVVDLGIKKRVRREKVPA